MIQWKDEKSDIEIIPFENFPFEELKIDKNKFYEYIEHHKVIFVKPSIWSSMWDYGKSSNYEMGGLLLGYVYKKHLTYIWYVDDLVINEEYEHSSYHLILYPSLWQKANEKILNEMFQPHKFIVGWFHTHPNFKPFFSSVDKKTHQHFFPFDYSLGIVLEPFSKEYKIYIGYQLTLYENDVVILELF